MLQVRNVQAFYGNIRALDDVSLRVPVGKIVTLLGSNGAGKTTMLRVIAGLLRCPKGEVEFQGERIERLEPEERVRRGMSLVPEGRELFPKMTVAENLELGAYLRKDRDETKKDLGMVFDLFPVLYERRTQKAGTLSGGEQQMLAIGRALMSKPKLLMLDEPSLGLAPFLVDKIAEVIVRIREGGVTVLLVEQNAGIALSISDQGYVLETGEIVLAGEAQDLMKNEMVRRSYLGMSATVP